MTTSARRIEPTQSDHFKGIFLPYLDSSHQAKFIALMDLIKTTADGVMTRGQLNAALYPNSDSKSIKTQLSTFKRALVRAASKAGYQLNLVSPDGRGSASQAICLTTDAPWQLPVPSSTREHTRLIAQQGVVSQQATPVEPLIVVSFSSKDRNSATELLEHLQTGLKARKDRQAKQIKFWKYTDDLRAGSNDNPVIQNVFRRAQMGLLLVSPAASSSSYIRYKEWPHFRDKEGNILKPFLAVQLNRVDPDKHRLGVLGKKKGKGRTQLFHCYHEGDSLSWNQCKEKEALKSDFIEKLIDEILYAKQSPDPDDLPSPPLPESPKSARPRREHRVCGVQRFHFRTHKSRYWIRTRKFFLLGKKQRACQCTAVK